MRPESDGVMQNEIPQQRWETYLDDFSKRNLGRTARIEVLGEELGAQEAEDKLPLQGITFEEKGSAAAGVEILLGETGDRNLTHLVSHVRRIVPKIGDDGREDALEIDDAEGQRTLLIFESLPEIPEKTS
jgi:uncharacterized protein DUF5335